MQMCLVSSFCLEFSVKCLSKIQIFIPQIFVRRSFFKRTRTYSFDTNSRFSLCLCLFRCCRLLFAALVVLVFSAVRFLVKREFYETPLY